MRTILGLSLVSLCAGAQQLDSSPKFEVASVRAGPAVKGAPHFVGCRGGPGTEDPARFRCSVTAAGLISHAYEFRSYQFTPEDWMRLTPVHIEAVVPAGATRDRLRAMERNLLAERFHFVGHFQKKEMAGFELIIGNSGVKFKPWAGEEPLKGAEKISSPKSADLRLPIDGPGDMITFQSLDGRTAIKARYSMPAFAEFLSGEFRSPVTDATGLTGVYNLMLDWVAPPTDSAPAALRASRPDVPSADGPTLNQAVASQLGLRLVSKKTMVDVLIVDRMDRTPSEN